MFTRNAIAKIKTIQGAIRVLALLNAGGYLYKEDAVVCDNDSFDYIVVGGGTGGGVVAARLVEANYSTLLIEAGGNSDIDSHFPGLVTYVKHSRIDWNFTAESNGDTGKCHKAGGGPLLGKVLGGSGETNYMIYARGNPRDYEQFVKASKDQSWSWNSMLKYFKKSEKLRDPVILNSPYGKYHSANGTIGVTKENRAVCDDYLPGFEEAGEAVVIDNIGAGTLGYSSALFYIDEGIRTDVAESYLPPLKNNPNLYLTRHSLATKIIFNKKKEAVGVTFVKNGKTVTVRANNEVIVSAGAIKSSQLLMLSGIGPKKELERMKINVVSNLPVGKNLQNVIGALLPFKTNRKANPEPFNAHAFPAPLIVGYSALNKSSIYPDYESLNFIIDDSNFLLSFTGFTLGFQNSLSDRLYLSGNNTQMLLTVVSNLNPKSRGEILLRSTDPFDQPRIIYRQYSNSQDLEAIVDYLLDYIKIEATPHFQDMGLEFLDVTKNCGQFEFGSRGYWRCYALCMIASTGRTCGGCSMGSVVDSKLRVLGVKKLRVVDVSAMPNSVSGVIYASAVALAEKGAEMIIESVKRRV